MREKSEPAKVEGQLRRPDNGGENIVDAGQLFLRNLANEFERDMKIYGIDPAQPGIRATELVQERRQVFAYFGRDRERHKEPHIMGEQEAPGRCKENADEPYRARPARLACGS